MICGCVASSEVKLQVITEILASVGEAVKRSEEENSLKPVANILCKAVKRSLTMQGITRSSEWGTLLDDIERLSISLARVKWTEKDECAVYQPTLMRRHSQVMEPPVYPRRNSAPMRVSPTLLAEARASGRTVCFFCSQFGHRSNQCLYWKMVSMGKLTEEEALQAAKQDTMKHAANMPGKAMITMLDR